MAYGRKTGGGSRLGKPNKATLLIKDIAQQYTEESVDALVRVMRSKDSPAVAVVKAAAELLDRGHGKATQHIEARVTPLEGLTDSVLLAAMEMLQSAAEARGEVIDGDFRRLDGRDVRPDGRENNRLLSH